MVSSEVEKLNLPTHLKMKNLTRHVSKFTVIVIGVSLLVAIIYLVFTQYRSQVALQQSTMNQITYDSEKRAAALSFFFSEQKENIVEISNSSELTAYFSNKKLGMSMEYGLQESLQIVSDFFNRISTFRKLGEQPLFDRIIFLDAAGKILSESHSPKNEWNSERDWRKFLAPNSSEPEFVYNKNDAELYIVLSAPCIYKGQYQGQILAWLSIPNIYDFFIEGVSQNTRYPDALVLDREYLHIPLKARSLLHAGNSSVPESIRPGEPYPFQIFDNKAADKAYGILIPVKKTLFSLLTFIPPKEQFDFQSPRQLLYNGSGLALFIISGFIYLMRLNTRNTQLSVHLQETIRHEQDLDEKNRQLESEIHERQIAEAHIRKLSHGIENSATAVFITDLSGCIEYVNAKFTAVTGFSSQEAVGQNPRILKSGLEQLEVYNNLWQTILRGDIWHGELQNRRKNGEVYWSVSSISPLRNAEGEISNFIANVEDATDRKNDEATIERLAYYDPLTCLPNRRLLQDRLAFSLKRSHRTGSNIALLYLDLDRFKYVNDSMGHHAGDLLLKEMALRFTELLRNDDMVCRLGGDEFAIILHDIGRNEYVAQVADKLIRAAGTPMIIDNSEVVVTVSVGIAQYPKDGDNSDTLAKNADIALYHAKSEGKNTYRFYDNELYRATSDRLRMEGALRHALDKHEFTLCYQPKISITQGKTVGVEALLRWHNDEYGSVSPSRFIPLAEETKLIIPIGEWVLRTACSQQVAWHQQGLELTMAVNLSAVQFSSPNLIERIAEIIDETGIEPGSLELELTESALVNSPDEATHILQQMRNLGVSVSIDDFGTGYSSLSYLKNFPVNVLKIDRTFVRDLANNSGDRAIARSIVDLAVNLGMKTVAEGVETNEQSRILSEIGCDFLQGFLFSRPVTAEQIPATIRDMFK